MNPDYLELSYARVGLATLLILINGAISVALKLGLHRKLALAALRTVVQLFLVGLVLQWVFSLRTWYSVLGLMLAMALVAGVAAVRRAGRRYPGIWIDSMISIWASSWLITGVALFAIVDVDPWFSPQFAIPLLGMILGNTLTGISLGLDRLGQELIARRGEIDGLLAMGATRWEAARGPVRTAIQTGMIPILNSMMVVGIVSLPGMMTGQLLAGIEPAQAVKYQVAIMFLIASATALGTVSVVLFGYRRLFSRRHQFLHGLLSVPD